MDQMFFHYAFAAIFVAFTMIRIGYHQFAARKMGRAEFKEGKLHIALRLIVGLPFMILLVAYMINPALLSWAEMSLPEWLQWVGLVLGLISLPLLWWIHWALGSNFSSTLHVREEHTLVTNGPYHWVRHPMYTDFYMFLTSILLLTGNWFIGGVMLVALTLIVVTRVKNEEAAMIEKFGDKYRQYMKCTGRFLPPIGAGT